MKTCLCALLRAGTAAVLAISATVAGAGPIRSTGAMTFADANTLIVADWRGGELHALTLPPAGAGAGKTFNLKSASGQIARALRTQPEKLRFEDLAFRPGADLAYISLVIDQGAAAPRAALVSMDSAGKVTVLDLAGVRHSSVSLNNPPGGDKRLWRDMPEATLTVTDLVLHEGRLYVAGLSNASFASTLRVYDFPFKGGGVLSSIEMYHPVHNELETRAPIRKMAVVNLNGEPTLLAAFTCTPLVTIPLKDLKDGAHIKAKTIAELGWGSAPAGMVTFDAGQGPMVLLVNSHKSADLMSIASIAEAAAGPGVTTPIKWPAEPLQGLRSIYIPMAGVARLGNQNKDFFGALRRNQESGAMELVSIRKGAFLRLSDFVNEYDFADFKYGAEDPWRQIHGVLRTDEGYPDLAKRAVP